MRAKHASHPTPAFPVYSAAFVSKHQLVLGGGGGQTRSGIKNKLRLYNVEDHQKIELISELELEKDDDVPMSMAPRPSTSDVVCGINSSVEKLEKGLNENCRLYGLTDNKLAATRSKGTLIDPNNTEDYQKVTAVSPDGAFVAVAGDHDLSLLTLPDFNLAANPLRVDKADIYDATFSPTTLVIATTLNLLVYSLPKANSSVKGKSKIADLSLVKTVDCPDLPGSNAGSNFRAARFYPTDDKVLFTISNTIPERTARRAKSAPRLAFVCRWDTQTWQVKTKKQIGDKGATCFDISADGKLMAYGLSDLTIGILDARTLAPLVRILKAHDFPPTTIKFNPTSNLLVSGSADNTLRIVSVPEISQGSSWQTIISILVAILVVLLAILANYIYGGPGLEELKWW